MVEGGGGEGSNIVMLLASCGLAQIENEDAALTYVTVHLLVRPQRENQIFTIAFEIQNFALEKEPS